MQRSTVACGTSFAHVSSWHAHSPGGDIRDIRQAVLDSRYHKDPPLDHRAARVRLAALPPSRQAATTKHIYFVMMGLLYKATPEVASVDYNSC